MMKIHLEFRLKSSWLPTYIPTLRKGQPDMATWKMCANAIPPHFQPFNLAVVLFLEVEGAYIRVRVLEGFFR